MKYTSMKYSENNIGYFPLLSRFVRHVITWGEGSKNMSAHFGKNRDSKNYKTKKILNKLNFHRGKMVKIDPSKYTSNEILEVTQELFTKAEIGQLIESSSNFIYTTDPSITLLAKPGDCPVAILFSTGPDKKPLLGLLHAGRKQLDIRLPFSAITFLHTLGYKPEDIHVGIAPSIAKEHYFILEKDKTILTNMYGWRNADAVHQDTVDHKIYLDLLGYFVFQLHTAGVPEENIEAYTIDTYSVGKKGEGFSHRLATSTKTDHINGRFLVAAQLFDRL